MKYIRTKYGKIYKTLEDYMQSDLPPTKIRVEDVAKDWHIIIYKSKIIKQADTIEELICDDDILYTYDLYPDAVLVVEGNIKPFGYPEAIKLKKFLDYKFKQFDLFIKDSKGNYIKRATTNDKGELELL